MAALTIPNVRVAGLAAAVPPLVELSWDDLGPLAEQLGVARRRHETPWRRMARVEQCQSDFCVEAAKPMLATLGWQPAEIDLVVMATLTPDYPIPATAIIVQDRLGLPKTTAAFDLPSGGLGFLHGLQVVASMLSGGGLKKALLLTGEVSKTQESSDFGASHRSIHGHSGSVCALEFSPESPAMYFDSGGDGSAFQSLYMPVGGVRNPPRPEMFDDPEGLREASEYVIDDASFNTAAARELPASIFRVLSATGRTRESLDGYYFTPLSLPAEAAVRKELGIPPDRFHSYINEYGQSGSGSIPLALIARAGSRLRTGPQAVALASMGPGLAWGSAIIETNRVVCPEIIEV